MRIADFGTRIAKEIQIRTPLRRYFFHRYSYMFSPAQLAFLCSCVEQAIAVPGGICEIGCAEGATTVFLNRHLDWLGVKRSYTTVDTFGGFTEADVTKEVERGKPASRFSGMFTVNSKTWFDRTMALNGLADRVRSIQADANEFDFTPLAPL